jgi:hypothetical protein
VTVFNVGDVLGTQEPFCLNVEDIVTGRTFIASITRWGKSWTTRKIVESCFGHAGIIILDPEGEYSSLREKFPFLIIGKDVPLQLETAEFMAEKILEGKINVIIDVSMVEDEEEAKEYVKLFLHKFFFLETTQRQPYLLVVEEAEAFGSERGIESQTCVPILINIVKRGGKRGIGSLFVAHRPAWISKGILSQCRNKAISAIESADFEALEKVARVPAEIIQKLPDLHPGEFFFVGDWVQKPTFAKIAQVQTTHLGSTPGLTPTPPSPKELAGVIATLQANLKSFVEKVTPTLPDLETLKKDAEAKAEIKANVRADERIKKETQRMEEQIKKQSTATQLQIEGLQKERGDLLKRIDLVSQTASLSAPTSPLSDILEHPIIKTNLEKLRQRDERAKNLLIRIQRDTEAKRYPTREELAAFLTASQDSVKRLVELINEVFQASVVVSEGKPMRYRSMLKRLFNAEIGRKEIERIEELQALKGTLENQVQNLKTAYGNVNIELGNLKKNYTVPEAVSALRFELADLRERCKRATPEMIQDLKNRVVDLDVKLKEAAKKQIESERLNSFFLRSFKLLKANFVEVNGLLAEVDLGYQKIQAEKQATVQEPIQVQEKQEKQEAPEKSPISSSSRTPEGPEPAASAPTTETALPVEAAPAQEQPKINAPAERYFSAPASAEHQKVLSFLKAHAEKEFSAFELSLALGVPEQVVYASPDVFSSQITVSPNGLSVKETKK